MPSRILFLLLCLVLDLTTITLAENPAKPPTLENSFTETKPTGTVTATILTGSDKDAFLKAHNDARKALGLPPLEWSDDIARYSLQWIKHNHPAYFAAAVADKPIPMQHRPHDGEFKQKHGENLAWWKSTGDIDPNSSKAVTLWLSEKADFDKLNKAKPYVVGDERPAPPALPNTGTASATRPFSNNAPPSTTTPAPKKEPPVVVGHYTQIVWRNTTTVGAARWTFKANGKTIIFVVANYAPPGNYLGQKPY